MLSLNKFLSLKKYRKMSVEKLCGIIGGSAEDSISGGGYEKLPGVWAQGKAETLHRKWHKKPLKVKVAASSTSSNKARQVRKAPSQIKPDCRSCGQRSKGCSFVCGTKKCVREWSV